MIDLALLSCERLIGLYQAREIIEAHHGRVDVQSEEGRGTTFTVTFPAATEAGR